jgi:hypothetical protein
MGRWKSTAVSASAPRSGINFGRAHIFVLLALAASPAVLILPLVPLTQVLPALSLVALAGAAIVSLLAWHIRAQTLWDFAGACAFVGFGAGMLTRPEHVLALLGVTSTIP